MADDHGSWCSLPIDSQLQVYVTFPVCRHRIHESCRDVLRFVHHRSTCAGCAADTKQLPLLDLGDDALFRRTSRHLMFQKRNQEILDAGPYKPSEIRVHCQEMFQMKASEIQNHRTSSSASDAVAGGAGWFQWAFNRGASEDLGRGHDRGVNIAANPEGQTQTQTQYNPHEALWGKAQSFALEHHSVEQFRENDISVVTLYDAGVTIDRMRGANYSLKELHKLNFTWEHMVVMGLNWKHLMDMLHYPTRDLADLFGVTYKTVVDLAAGQGDSTLGVERFCAIHFDKEDMDNLGLDNLQRLVDLGMTRADFIKLCESLTLDDMLALKLTPDILARYELMYQDMWAKLKWGDPHKVADKLGVPPDSVPLRKRIEVVSTAAPEDAATPPEPNTHVVEYMPPTTPADEAIQVLQDRHGTRVRGRYFVVH